METRCCSAWCILWVHVYTMSLCLYHESMSKPRVHVNTMSPCLFHASMFISWVLSINISPSLYHESKFIPWVQVYTMSPCLFHASMFISWVLSINISQYLYQRKAPWSRWRNLDRPNLGNLTVQMDDGPIDVILNRPFERWFNGPSVRCNFRSSIWTMVQWTTCET